MVPLNIRSVVFHITFLRAICISEFEVLLFVMGLSTKKNQTFPRKRPFKGLMSVNTLLIL